MTFPQRKKQKLYKEISQGTCPAQKIERVARQLSFVACRSKIKYPTEEAAAANIYKYPIGVEPYLCPNGNDHLHFGHVPNWVGKFKTIVVKKQEAKKRNPRTKPPKWKSDPRLSND